MKNACEHPSTGEAGRFALMLQDQLPIIATERLILRSPRVEDFDQYTEIKCSERARFIGGPMERDAAWAEFSNATANWILHGHGLWTVGHAGDVVGFVQIGFEPGDLEPVLVVMVRAQHEGRGLANEAATAARDYAWNTLGWTRLVSYIHPRNLQGRRLCTSIGGRMDGDADSILIYHYHRETHA